MIRKIYTLLILGLCLGFAACSDDNDGLDPNAAAPVIKFPMEQLDVDLNKVDNLPVVAVIKSQAGLQSVTMKLQTVEGVTEYKTVTEFFNPNSYSLSENLEYNANYEAFIIEATDKLNHVTSGTLPIAVTDVMARPVITFDPEEIIYDEMDENPVIPRTTFEVVYSPDFIREIKQIIAQARQKAYTAINSAMVEAYWQMGRRIVEQEQQGKDRADYGSQLLKSLSKELTAEFGKGFSLGSLYYYRQFYQTFPEIFATPWRILTWSHYKRLMQVSNANARTWYLKEAAEQMWSYRTLDRNIGSQYYERLLLSQHKDTVEGEMNALTAPFDKDRMEFIKNPTVAEFIGLSPNSDFTETELEGAIIGNLQKFLLELGKGFSFVARQKLVRTEKKDYFIDLVFYMNSPRSACNPPYLHWRN